MWSMEQDLDAPCLMNFVIAAVNCSWKDTSFDLTNGAVTSPKGGRDGGADFAHFLLETVHT